jgi:hypothetical protein
MFLHSTDGGKTWDVDIENLIVGAVAVSISFPTPAVGFAVVLNSITQSSSVAKYGG